MSEIHFVDTTLRDGQQSLWALGMRTGAMLPIAAKMDQAGFESMEFFVSIMIKKYVREHKENPWVWLREGTKRFRRTRLRYHGGMRGSGSFESQRVGFPAACCAKFIPLPLTKVRHSRTLLAGIQAKLGLDPR